jgi:hypothetical protein
MWFLGGTHYWSKEAILSNYKTCLGVFRSWQCFSFIHEFSTNGIDKTKKILNHVSYLGEDAILNDQPYRYLTADDMKSLGDDSLPIDVTKDERTESAMSHKNIMEISQSKSNLLFINISRELNPLWATRVLWKSHKVSHIYLKKNCPNHNIV